MPAQHTPPTPSCPDCPAQLGEPHDRECTSAICITSGTPRIQHADDDLPDGHVCGEAVWTGYPAGTIEAITAGLFVRPATAADKPLIGWLPCPPGDTGAVPDLHRVMLSGHWNPAAQTFELPGIGKPMITPGLDQVLALRLPPKDQPIIVPKAHASHRIRRGAWVETRGPAGEEFHLADTGLVVVRRWWSTTATVLWASGRTAKVPIRTIKRIPQDIR